MKRLLLLLALLCAGPALAQTNSQVSVPTTYVDGSGVIAAGGTSQQVFAGNGRRVSLVCVNPTTATEPLLVDFGIPAVTASAIPLVPGGSVAIFLGAVPVGTVNVNAATTGHAFICKQGFRQF